MNAVLREYIAKGVFLALWTYLALTQSDWGTFGRILAWTGAGLGLGLVAGGVVQVLRGFRFTANLPAFLLIVLLDSPFFIYLGMLGGLAAGVIVETDRLIPTGMRVPGATVEGVNWLGYFVAAGAVLGFGFFQLRGMKDWWYRFAIGGVVGAILVYLGDTYLAQLPAFAGPPGDPTKRLLALQLLIGVPFFYLLTFCGEAEESEIEIAALCAVIALALYYYRLSSSMPPTADKLIFLVPLVLYYVYVRRVLPGLRVFKHTLRGYGALSLKRYREAMLSFSRALQLDRRNQMAADGLWRLVRRVDVSTLDDETAKMLPFEFCLSMAGSQLIGERPPSPAERAEAVKTLDVVDRHRPDLSGRTDYLRAVAFTHAREFDSAAAILARLLDPETPYPPQSRAAVQFSAWDLALRLHPELVKRLGLSELAKPGRRIGAIAAVEQQLAADANDSVALELKRELYSGLGEDEFVSASATAPPTDFNYDYVEQLGLALIGESEPARVERGMAYLRIAGRGLPGRGPAIFKTLADLASKRGQSDEALGYLGQVKRSGLVAGPGNLAADQRELYLAALKELAEGAASRGDFTAAVDDLRLYVEAGKEDVPTLRRLAELYAQSGDPLNALLIVERGLLYAKGDKDLLDKKDSYYYSADVERVRAVKEKVAGWFDVAYCLRKARQVADQKDVDSETLDYGLHLARLARAIDPFSHGGMLAEARLLLRKGERQAGLEILENIHGEKRGSGEEEDAWYIATRILGRLYLEELGRPDLAIACFDAYREYQRSGADTWYDLGRAYEAKGDVPAAIKAYEMVTAYERHPLYWDATEAVRRLKDGGMAV